MDIFDEFKRMQESIFENINRALSADFKKPMSEISQSAKEITISINLPGINKKDISLEVQRTAVIIKAEVRKKKIKREKKKYSETRSFKGFYRKIPLPGNLDIDSAKATFNKNKLIIKIPKIIIRKVKIR